MCSLDVDILALLDAADKQYHQSTSILTEVNPVSWTKINPVFHYPGASTLNIGKITLLQSVYRSDDLYGRDRVQPIKPLGIWATSFSSQVFPYFNHTSIATYMLLFSKFFVELLIEEI